MRPYLFGLGLLGIGLFGLSGCSYASIDSCYNSDNTLTATIDGQAFNIECVEARVAENENGTPILGILTSPDPDGLDPNQREFIQLNIADPEAGETYTFRGSPNAPSFGDPPPDEGAFITISEVQRFFSNDSPTTGSVTLDTYTSTRASGTFETTFANQPVRGQFDVTF